MVVGELVNFLSSEEMTDSLRMRWNWPAVSDRLTVLVIVEIWADAYYLGRQMVMELVSDCLLLQFERILQISY